MSIESEKHEEWLKKIIIKGAIVHAYKKSMPKKDSKLSAQEQHQKDFEWVCQSLWDAGIIENAEEAEKFQSELKP